MAQPNNLFDRYDVNPSVREDLIDKIYNVSPEEVPVTTAIGKATAKNTYHEWQRDDLATPNKDSALIDGDEFMGQPIKPTERVGNYCQIFNKQPAVSRRANIVDKAGMKTAMAYQKAKMIKEMKRDIEAMVLSDNAAVAGNSTTPSKSASFGAMIYTNVNHGAGGSTPAHVAGAATVAPTAGTLRPFTEALLKDVVAKAYTSSGEIPQMVVMSPHNKEMFSTFTGIAANREAVKSGKQARIVAGADLYMSNFGELEIIPHYIMANSTDVFLLNPDYAELAFLDGFRFEEMGKTGDNQKLLLTADLCLRVDSEKAMGKIADLDPNAAIPVSQTVSLTLPNAGGVGGAGGNAPAPAAQGNAANGALNPYYASNNAPMGEPPNPQDPNARRENLDPFLTHPVNQALRKEADAREAALRVLEESTPATGSIIGQLAEPFRSDIPTPTPPTGTSGTQAANATTGVAPEPAPEPEPTPTSKKK